MNSADLIKCSEILPKNSEFAQELKLVIDEAVKQYQTQVGGSKFSR